MELSEALSKVDNLVVYGNLAERNLRVLQTTSPLIISSSRSQNKDIQRALVYAWATHDDLYGKVDRLHVWANIDKPLPIHYGLKIKRLLLYMLGKNYNTRDNINYSSDIDYYRSLEKDFAKHNIISLIDLFDRYNPALQDIIEKLEPYHRYDDITDLIDNYIETQNFRKDAKEIVDVIRKNKKDSYANLDISSRTNLTEGEILLQCAKDIIQNKKVYSNDVLIK